MKETPTKTIWVTREGQRIRVRKMDDRHIVNTLCLLTRWGHRMKDELLYGAFRVSGMLQGEEASMCIQQEIRQLERMDVDEFLSESIPTYDALVDEAERRKLDWSEKEKHGNTQGSARPTH
jgi:hypothetical protein